MSKCNMCDEGVTEYPVEDGHCTWCERPVNNSEPVPNGQAIIKKAKQLGLILEGNGYIIIKGKLYKV